MISKINGPPGCGKTFFLMRQIERACEKYDPSKIGAVSFTRAAVVEMRNRVANTLGMSQASAKNIRTIHSHCFKLLGLSKEDIVKDNSPLIKEWNEAYPYRELPIKSMVTDLEDGEIGRCGISQKGNADCFSRMNILRNRMIPIEQWEILDNEAFLFYQDWSRWLSETNRMDFTMILEEVLKLQLRPDIDVLFLDECQDMSKLQVKVVQMWGERCAQVVFCGDEDQTLFRFAGSAPEDFRNLQHDYNNVLQQSYRVPIAVHEYAAKMISQIEDREKVDFLPTQEEGEVINCFYPDLDLEGSHMILSRCHYHLDNKWINYLIDKGYVWHNPYREEDISWNPTSTNLWKAVQSYDQLQRGLNVKGSDIINMISKLPAEIMERGVKTNRKKLIDMEIGPDVRVDVFKLAGLPFFKADFWNFSTWVGKLFPLAGHGGKLIEKHGEAITRQIPMVILGTYHSVKGGESDHVWVDKRTSPTIYRATQQNDQNYYDEIRAAYVAVTRARKSLGILEGYSQLGIW